MSPARSMSKCPYCEQLSPAASKFCSECGAALHLQPCPQCGALNDIGKTTQCGRCEAPLLLPPELASEDATEDKPATAPLPGADDRHSQHEPPLALALPLGLGGAARDGPGAHAPPAARAGPAAAGPDGHGRLLRQPAAAGAARRIAPAGTGGGAVSGPDTGRSPDTSTHSSLSSSSSSSASSCSCDCPSLQRKPCPTAVRAGPAQPARPRQREHAAAALGALTGHAAPPHARHRCRPAARPWPH